MGSVGFFEFMLLPEWKKELKVKFHRQGQGILKGEVSLYH
jgi:hypothetical protein